MEAAAPDFGMPARRLRAPTAEAAFAAVGLAGILAISVMLVLASRQITFADFGADLVTNISNFSHGVIDLVERFRRGSML